MIGDREPLAWVLTDQRMAFSHGRSRLASQLKVSDRLFLYATRGCFHNPGRDRGRVIGEAVVASTVKGLTDPVVFGGQSFPVGCDLRITGLAARGAGPELRDMVGRLHLFPDPRTWSVRMRRVLVPLDAHDAAIVHSELEPHLQARVLHLAGYLDRVRSRPATAMRSG